jgi:hypothetical protein
MINKNEPTISKRSRSNKNSGFNSNPGSGHKTGRYYLDFNELKVL